jgi:hypothetical protein
MACRETRREEAYQALKACAAGLAVSYRNAPARYFSGGSGSRREDAWGEPTGCVMPPDRLGEAVTAISEVGLRLAAEVAVGLHRLQYGGFDRGADISPYVGGLVERHSVTRSIYQEETVLARASPELPC